MRALTDNERAVLAHVVLDPDGWWSHAQTAPNIADPEAALRAKIERWQADYVAASTREGYRVRAEREG